MKGDAKVLKTLNTLLADELPRSTSTWCTPRCANWGYEKLHKAIEKQAVEEMHHAEWLIARILFREGTPVVSKLNAVRIGKDVKAMVTADYDAEVMAVKSYNEAIKLATAVRDDATRDLLTKILKDEESHVDWNEQQRAQTEQMGLENYLANQAD